MSAVMLRTDTNMETEWLVKSLIIVPFHKLFFFDSCCLDASLSFQPITDQVPTKSWGIEIKDFNLHCIFWSHWPLLNICIHSGMFLKLIRQPWHIMNLPCAQPTYSRNLHSKCEHHATSVHLDSFCFLSNQGLGAFASMQYASQPFYDVSPESYTHSQNIITELWAYLSHKNYCQRKVYLQRRKRLHITLRHWTSAS